MNEDLSVSSEQINAYQDFNHFCIDIALANAGYWIDQGDVIKNTLLSSALRGQITLPFKSLNLDAVLSFRSDSSGNVSEIYRLEVSTPSIKGLKTWSRSDTDEHPEYWFYSDSADSDGFVDDVVEVAQREFDSQRLMSGESVNLDSDERLEATFEAYWEAYNNSLQGKATETELGLKPKYATLEEMLGGFAVLKAFSLPSN